MLESIGELLKCLTEKGNARDKSGDIGDMLGRRQLSKKLINPFPSI
jgi:hypothetical protein